VQFRHVSKRFGSLQVLDDVSLSLPRGQVTVVLGPSGTGKSVLLKHIAGLLRPDKGEVWFDGQRVDALGDQQWVAIRQRIGFLFQMGALFDSMTVGENVTFPLREHTKMTPAQRRERCQRVLHFVGLADIEAKMPAELSGGVRKRVALARASVVEPELVLYDEPTTGLDPVRSDVIDELICSLGVNLGITSLVVTHDMNSANKIADRMLMLSEGKIRHEAAAADFGNTTDPVVQRFIRGEADPKELATIREGF